ncbi:hypothetical protein BY996DRAFT_988193 [Phakopsora pachyrhizi]|nr:hypothetical protein BY996DRAFT_988193 [Phakopsora pachyrhizi]
MEDKELLGSFSEEEEFFAQLDLLISLPEIDSNGKECGSYPLGPLTRVLDSYQEQPYLLDPYLERIVIPVIRGMRRVLELLQRPMEVKRPDGKTFDDIFSNPISAGIKLDQIAQFLYWLTKIRGHKTIGKYLTRTLMQSSTTCLI